MTEMFATAITRIISNILTALHQTFWFSILAAFLFMFLYLYGRDHGWLGAHKLWIKHFKKSSRFRNIFVLAFCTVMILMRTLLNRNMWANPLSDIMGGWTFTNVNGELTTEPIENVILMIPFTSLLLWAWKDRLVKKGQEKTGVFGLMFLGLKFGFLFSLTIETLQLFLRLGTVQLSDLFYNTLGGMLGGLVYYICEIASDRRR